MILDCISRYLFRLYYFITGEWVLDKANSSLKNVKIHTAIFEGFYVEFYCQEISYTLRYNRFFIPNKTIKTYKLFMVVDDKAPDYIKEKAKIKVILPDFAPNWLRMRHKKKHMLNVFLDVLAIQIDPVTI